MPRAPDLHAGVRAALNGLEDHAIFVGELHQLIQRSLRGIGVDVKGQADFLETDRDVLRDAERAAQIDVTFGGDDNPT